MRVRVLRDFAGPQGLYYTGDVREVPDAQAVDWIRAGHVARETEHVETTEARPIPERAVMKGGRRGA